MTGADIYTSQIGNVEEGVKKGAVKTYYNTLNIANLWIKSYHFFNAELIFNTERVYISSVCP